MYSTELESSDFLDRLLLTFTWMLVTQFIIGCNSSTHNKILLTLIIFRCFFLLSMWLWILTIGSLWNLKFWTWLLYVFKMILAFFLVLEITWTKFFTVLKVSTLNILFPCKSTFRKLTEELLSVTTALCRVTCWNVVFHFFPISSKLFKCYEKKLMFSFTPTSSVFIQYTYRLCPMWFKRHNRFRFWLRNYLLFFRRLRFFNYFWLLNLLRFLFRLRIRLWMRNLTLHF